MDGPKGARRLGLGAVGQLLDVPRLTVWWWMRTARLDPTGVEDGQPWWTEQEVYGWALQQRRRQLYGRVPVTAWPPARRPASYLGVTDLRGANNRPPAPFTPTFAGRPGELVQIDSTPLDVMVLLDSGVPGRPELTMVIDVATRTIAAAVLRPAGTKAVDTALLLARTLVPEPMRPGWSTALRMSASRLPHARLLAVDARRFAVAPCAGPSHDQFSGSSGREWSEPSRRPLRVSLSQAGARL